MTDSLALRADCRVVLVGMMGSGKSTVGKLLARQLGWRYVDNDDLLEQESGETAKQLLDDRGEQGLRAGETDAFRAGLATARPCVISAPAGTILDPSVRNELELDALVVWLTASPRTLARRARGSAHRPWLNGDAQAWMTSTLAERAPLYDEVADLTVNTERRRPAAVAHQIAGWLAERCS